MAEMTDNQRLHLQNMIKANNVEDQTELIRKLKHSELFKIEIQKILEIKEMYKEYPNAEEKVYNDCITEANFLYTYYTDLFNKIRKDEINIELLYKFVDILKQIEDGKEDQHSASFLVGTILKQIYIDSALKKSEKLDEKNEKEKLPEKNVEINVSWAEFKKSQEFKKMQKPKKNNKK
jgi:hypothetical protein